MLPIIKVLLGFAGAGVSAVVPVAVKRIGQHVNINNGIRESIQTTTNKVEESFKRVEQSVGRKIVSEVLRDLVKKECKLVANTANLNNTFNAIHACKGETANKTDFYYLGSEDSIKTGTKTSLVEKIETINFVEGKRWLDYLDLKLTNGEEVRIAIEQQGKAGWAHFKNVNIGNNCKAEYPYLRCNLGNYAYDFSILL